MPATERVYYADGYAARFAARVEAVEGSRVYLDRTAFYPTSGGQPNDLGTLAGLAVTDVVDEDERIAHIVEGVSFGEGTLVEGAIDWARRWDHMQQHSGQHLLSATLERHFGLRTISFHMGAEACTIDLEAGVIAQDVLGEAERLANAYVQENRALGVVYEDSASADGLRKPSERHGTLRIITIADLDRSACGGTHVRTTGEIGAILLGKTEKIRNSIRLEFVCGQRAIARARRDFDALSAAARSFSAPMAQVPALVAAQMERLVEAEKIRAKLEAELAAEGGRALYRATAATSTGLRLAVEKPASLTDATRARAQGFVEGGRAVYVALCAQDASLLVAASADSGVNAGQWLKPLLARLNGKGGGSPTLAQGRLPNQEALAELAAEALGQFSA